MKKYTKQIFQILLVMSFFIAGSVSAQGMMGNYNRSGTSATQTQDANLKTALQDILTSQNVNDQKQIVCNKVTDVQFEKLGDAYMGLGITEQQHSAMENMMGGEGSVTLTEAHINMGRAYIGCWANYPSNPQNMLMMGQSGGISRQVHSYGNMMNDSSMMGSYFGGFHLVIAGITLILFWTLLVLGIMALLKWLKKNK